MSDITLGQYMPGNSIIHRLDPRVKLMGTLVFIVMLFLTDNILGYLLITAALITCIAISKIPPKKLLKGLRGILVIILFTAVMNIFFTNGTVIFHWHFISITKEGLIKAGYVAIRLSYLIIGTSIMTLTTTPADMSDGLEKAFKFLKVIHFPVHEIAMIMSLALRFIPTLMEEAEKIKKAQLARGADFGSGNLIKRVKSLLPILIPLFVASIKRALELATAMESRCYKGGERTKLHPLKYERRDIIAYIIFALYILAIVGINYAVYHVPALAIFVVESVKAK